MEREKARRESGHGRRSRNVDAWYAAIDVKRGETLYLSPQDRVRIW
jgi:predicted metalloendopeptidase